MAKLDKSEVQFEHPAKGPHHCSQCTHFLDPGCRIVKGRVTAPDWCIKFDERKVARARKRADHLNSLGG